MVRAGLRFSLAMPAWLTYYELEESVLRIRSGKKEGAVGAFVVITNPNAKLNRKMPDRFGKLKAIVGDRGFVFETVVPENIQALADDLVGRQEIDILGICGGDGTLQHTLTAFIKAYGGELPPAVLPLRGGTMNQTAHSVGITLSAEQHLANVLDAVGRSETVRTTDCDLMKLSMDEGDRYGFLFGNGLVASYLDMYHASPYDGPKAAIWAIRKGLVAFMTKNGDYDRFYRRPDLTVTIEGFELPLHSFMGILAGTIPEVGIGFEPLYRADRKEGRFHILASGLSAGQVIRNLPRFFKGERLCGKNHYDFLASEATIESDVLFRYMVDGELAETNKIHLSIGLRPTILVH